MKSFKRIAEWSYANSEGICLEKLRKQGSWAPRLHSNLEIFEVLDDGDYVSSSIIYRISRQTSPKVPSGYFTETSEKCWFGEH